MSEYVVVKFETPKTETYVFKGNFKDNIYKVSLGFKNKERLKKAMQMVGLSAEPGRIGDDSTGTTKVSLKLNNMMGFIEENGEMVLLYFKSDDNIVESILNFYKALEIQENLQQQGFTIASEMIQNQQHNIILQKDKEVVEITYELGDKVYIHSKNFKNHEECDKIIKDNLPDEAVVITETKTNELYQENIEDEEKEFELEEDIHQEEENEREIEL